MTKPLRTVFVAAALAGAAALPFAVHAADEAATAPSDQGRPAADVARDAARKPDQLMHFAGVKAGSKVVELAPGRGYYTRLLSLAVGPKGYVYSVTGKATPEMKAWANMHGNVAFVSAKPGEALAPEPVDIVWTTLNYHDFLNTPGVAEMVDKAAFAALKPGGVYLVNDHQTAKGAGSSETNTLHRVEDTVVIAQVEKAGFKLAGRSNMLANPADDHTKKVFDPAIEGHTDQFVLKFVKPR